MLKLPLSLMMTEPIKKPTLRMVAVKDLIPNPRNSRHHTAEEIAELAGIIKAFGWRDPILIDGKGGIIAGHRRHKAAMLLDLDTVPCIDCKDMTEADIRAFMLAHNRTALNASWDTEILGGEVRDLTNLGYSARDLGFSQDEIDEMVGGQGGDALDADDERYTQKLETPIYEPTGDRPAVSDLFDGGHAAELVAEIDGAELPDDVADFLRQAARRHTVFNFAKIAEFYAHADPVLQALMERSALVIIDYGAAVENGFVKLAGAVAREYEEIAE